MSIHRDSRHRGFTLVELLVVIAIIGILVGLLLPAVQAAREAARRMQCTNNLKQVTLAALNYENTHKKLPAARIGCDGDPACPLGNGPMQNQGASVFVQLLPFMEQQALYDLFSVQTKLIWTPGNWNWNDPELATAIATPLADLTCPSDGEREEFAQYQHNVPASVRCATGSYAGVAGDVGPPAIGPDLNQDVRRDPRGDPFSMKYNNTGVFFYVRQIKMANITDGLSNTMFFGETIQGHLREHNNIWTNGNRGTSSMRTTFYPLNTMPELVGLKVPSQDSHAGFNSLHPAGANFSYGDGSVSFVEDGIDGRTYREMSTRLAAADGYDDTPPTNPTPR